MRPVLILDLQLASLCHTQKSKGPDAAAGLDSVSDPSLLAQVQSMEAEADDLERKVAMLLFRSMADGVLMFCLCSQLMTQTEAFAAELADLDMRLFEVELQVGMPH